jgi:hypothetical protein
MHEAAVAAMQLQNRYALAIDTRAWEMFASLFTPDVVATYPNATFEGIAAWMEFFVPFHDTCLWTQHSMTTHVAGEDDRGAWATCYGSVRWIEEGQPDVIQHAEGLYRDRLVQGPSGWQIASRNLDLLLVDSSPANADGVMLPNSVRQVIERRSHA